MKTPYYQTEISRPNARTNLKLLRLDNKCAKYGTKQKVPAPDEQTSSWPSDRLPIRVGKRHRARDRKHGPRRRIAFQCFLQDIARDRRSHRRTAAAMVNDDRTYIAWIIRRRIGDEQGMVSLTPWQVLVVNHAASALRGRNAPHLGCPGLAFGWPPNA